MGLLEAASITVPDAAGETYVVISMQPLSDISNRRATVRCHFPMCGLTVKLSGRPKAPDQAPRVHNLFRAGGAITQVVHGPPQRLLERTPGWGLHLHSRGEPRCYFSNIRSTFCKS